MQYIYKFNLSELISLDTYIDFIELYLKNNRILKKKFFEETSICANSYRFFLTHREKNRNYYYNIISNTYDMTIPNEEEMLDLSKKYSKIVEDILYKRYHTFEENVEIIKAVKRRSNQKNEDKIFSIEGILFELLDVIVHLSFGKLSSADQCKLLTACMDKVRPYAPLVKGIYSLLYDMVDVLFDSYVKNIISYHKIDEAMEKTKNYTFLQPLLYSVLSDAYLSCKEYSNAALACIQAYKGFENTFNFQRAIPIRMHLAYIYIQMNSYYNAYQTLYYLFLSKESFCEEQRKIIIQGMVDAYLLLERYNDVCEFVESNIQYATVDMELERLFAIGKMKQKERFKDEKEKFMDKYNSEEYEAYHILIENMELLMNKEKLQLKKREPLSKMINTPEKKTLLKICKNIFNKNKF